MIKNSLLKLAQIAEDLESQGLIKESDAVLNVMQRLAEPAPYPNGVPNNTAQPPQAPVAAAAKPNYFQLANINPQQYSGTATQNEALRRAINPNAPDFYSAYVQKFGGWNQNPTDRITNLNGGLPKAVLTTPQQAATLNQKQLNLVSQNPVAPLIKALAKNNKKFNLKQAQAVPPAQPSTQAAPQQITQAVDQYMTTLASNLEANFGVFMPQLKNQIDRWGQTGTEQPAQTYVTVATGLQKFVAAQIPLFMNIYNSIPNNYFNIKNEFRQNGLLCFINLAQALKSKIDNDLRPHVGGFLMSGPGSGKVMEIMTTGDQILDGVITSVQQVSTPNYAAPTQNQAVAT